MGKEDVNWFSFYVNFWVAFNMGKCKTFPPWVSLI